VSEAEDPTVSAAASVTVEDVRKLMGASTPHFALQLGNRIARLIEPLPAGHPARLEGEAEIARLDRLGRDGELRGRPGEDGLGPLASLGDSS